VDALVHDKAIDQTTYEQQRARLSRERDQLLDALSIAPSMDLDINATLSFAWGLLEDLPGCWNRLSSQHRDTFLRIVFPEGLTYRDGAIGTAHPSWLFGVFGPENDAEEALVAPTGCEPDSAARKDNRPRGTPPSCRNGPASTQPHCRGSPLRYAVARRSPS
jgi:hypothetical protein